jgi:hypothetical protein
MNLHWYSICIDKTSFVLRRTKFCRVLAFDRMYISAHLFICCAHCFLLHRDETDSRWTLLENCNANTKLTSEWIRFWERETVTDSEKFWMLFTSFIQYIDWYWERGYLQNKIKRMRVWNDLKQIFFPCNVF